MISMIFFAKIHIRNALFLTLISAFLYVRWSEMVIFPGGIEGKGRNTHQATVLSSSRE